ncbi:hypothetical protein [Nostoc sp.]|uniref:hypothetical protein n=1 Tax=Nostoc sp. TaxID=1180 RepID=UPI002FFA2EB4
MTFDFRLAVLAFAIAVSAAKSLLSIKSIHAFCTIRRCSLPQMRSRFVFLYQSCT